jgi:hypothetical protein
LPRLDGNTNEDYLLIVALAISILLQALLSKLPHPEIAHI